MREVGIAIVAAIAIGGLLAPEKSESRGRGWCAAPRGVEIARSKETRVYRERRGRDNLVIACHLRTGRVSVLQSSEQGIYVYPPPAIALRGELVAYAEENQSDPVSPFLTSISVMNVRTGRPASRYALADPPNTNAKVGSVAVSRRASVAWIACEFGGTSEAEPRPECTRPGTETRVYRLTAGSEKPEVLEQGTTIDPRSLRLVAGNVKWKNGGDERVAPLDGTAPAHPDDPSACKVAGKRVVASNGVVIVYREPRDSAAGGESYACARRSGNLVQLDGPAGGSTMFPPPAIALAGYKVAFAVDTLTSENEGGTDVWTIDARKPDIEAQQQGTRVRTTGRIGSVVLHPSGAVAWISCDAVRTGEGRLGRACTRPGALDRVYRLNAGTRKPKLLDKGRDIDPSSLRRRGTHISWLAGRTRRTAALG